MNKTLRAVASLAVAAATSTRATAEELGTQFSTANPLVVLPTHGAVLPGHLPSTSLVSFSSPLRESTTFTPPTVIAQPIASSLYSPRMGSGISMSSEPRIMPMVAVNNVSDSLLNLGSNSPATTGSLIQQTDSPVAESFRVPNPLYEPMQQVNLPAFQPVPSYWSR